MSPSEFDSTYSVLEILFSISEQANHGTWKGQLLGRGL